MSARERMVEVVRQALAREAVCEQTVESLTAHVAEAVVGALVAHGPAVDGGSYRAGWLIGYGRVHDVTETSMEDGLYHVWTRDLDPDSPDYD